MTALLLASLLACVKPYEELATLDFAEVPFDNPLVTSGDARIRTFETTLPCPDGTKARFYLVYRSDLTEPAPAALVFHSGAFDYVLDPSATPEDPLYGATWRAESRLDRDWSDRMVWATLGMYPDVVDASEDNQGALPAALIDAGIVQLVPGNCWADLWHNEASFQDNDFAYENFNRNGRTFAWWMVRMLYEDGFAANMGIELPVELSGELYLAGLGDGGRAAVELLTHDGLPPVSGLLLDSTPDLLSPYLDPIAELDFEREGIERIFPNALDREQIDDWSLLALLQAEDGAGDAPPGFDPGAGDTGDTGAPSDTEDTGVATVPDTGGIDDLSAYAVPPRIVFVWSQADPRQPQATTQATADALQDRDGAWVLDTRARGHVFSNADADAARSLVDFLVTGTQAEITWQTGGDAGDDTSGSGS